jgi:hypothetical protein
MKRKEENRSVIEPSCTFSKPNKINCLPSNRVLDRKPDRVIDYKVLIDLTSLIYTVVCTSLQFIIKHIIYARCIDTVVCTSLQFTIKHIIYVRCIYTVVCTSLQFIIKHIIYVRCIYTVVCTSLQFIIKHIIYVRCIYTRDGNQYPVNRVLARTSDYRIPKSVFGYSENFFLWK